MTHLNRSSAGFCGRLKNTFGKARGLASVILTVLVLEQHAFGAIPDFTNGGVPDDDKNINLGPTGTHGWIYHESVDSSLSRQILVTAVEVGSPADGILAINDVILGVDGTGATPVAFSSDARIALGMAIGDAEARNPATLKLLRWRAGVTDVVEITLQTMGAYSATAPYNCPKSALILEQGLQEVMANQNAGNFGLNALTLLAANDPNNPANAARQATAQAWALALILTQEEIDERLAGNVSTASKVPWRIGHELIVLAEYYLSTGDTQVLPSIEAMAVEICNGQSALGTMGHQFTNPVENGYLNGPYNVGYGAVNSSGLPCYFALLLADKCGISRPEMAPAIARATNFFAGYASYGTLPYGEQLPIRTSHESNGKSGLTALALSLEGNRPESAKFFAKMASAAASEREIGHCGAYFSYLWAPLGANVGGEESAAAHFSRIAWRLDLNRRWDGGFDYDSWYHYSTGGPTYGSDFWASTPFLLSYAMPLRQLTITGKNQDPTLYISSAEVSETVLADTYDATTRTTVELIGDLGLWSPKAQAAAAAELGDRTTEHATLIPQLIAMANDTGAGEQRVGACYALGEIGNGAAAADLATLLTDSDEEVRFASACAMRSLPNADNLTHLNSILAAAASTSRPFDPLNDLVPLQFAHAQLSILLFYSGSANGPKGVIWGDRLDGVDRDFLYPAIEAVAATPSGSARSTLNETYVNLTYDDVLTLSGAILDSITLRAPADKMFSDGVRTGGVEAMEMYDIADGVKACMKFIEDVASDNSLALLGTFGGGIHTVEPNPDVAGFLEPYLVSHPDGARMALYQIATDINPIPLTALKTVQLTTADDLILDLPATSTVLRATGMDHAQGDSIYTWKKVFGPGAVTFSPNGTAAAANSTVQIDGTPGAYEFEVTMSDSRGLTESYGTVVVLVSDGSAADTTAPPATGFATAPTGASFSSITMTAQVVTDPEGNGVKYYFTCTSGGGNDSGWQNSPTYTDTGLMPDTTYEYTVTVRDLSGNLNTSAASPPSAAITSALPTSTLAKGVFHILGSQNSPTSNTSHKVSVNGAHAGFQGQGNVDSTTVPVNETFNGTIIDYAFIRESATPDLIETYVDGGAGRITYGSYLPREGSSLDNTSEMKLWTATDPGGPAYVNPADFTSSTSVRSFDNINGSIDISGVTVGTVYFFYSTFRSTPIFSAAMKDAEMVFADVSLPVFGDGDSSNNWEHYVCSINFVNNDGCETIEWSLTSTLNGEKPMCAMKGIVLVTTTGQTATIPNVVGLTQTAAQNSIKSAGFLVGSVLLRSSSTVPAGTVISQRPSNGITAIESSAVNLVVSSGLPTTAVPNVLGLEQSVAESQIVAEGLVVGNVTTKHSTTVSVGDVISQSPSGDSLLVFGGSVDLVVSGNAPPVANDDSVSVDQGSSVGITLIAMDPDVGESIAYSVVAGPTNGALSGTAPNLTYTPNGNYSGPDSFTFKVTDASAADSNIATISITVKPINHAPVFAVDPINGSDATEDSVYAASIAGSASDIDDGASLSYEKVSGPAWLSVAANGTLSGTPTNSDVGANVFTVSVTDSIDAPVNATLNITVTNTNDAPVFTVNPIKAMNARVDSPYSRTIGGSAVDVDAGAELVYTKVSGPAWLSVAANGTLSGTPVISDLGINTFIVNVTDGIIGAPVEATLEINVTETGSSLSQAAFFIVGSQNAPSANLNFDVSVYDGMAGFKGQGNVGSLSVPVDEDILGTVVDYRFINESSTPDVAQIYSEKPGSDIISETALTGIGSLQNTNVADLWTVSDPGVAYSSTADFSSNTVTVGVTSMTGSVDVSSLISGTIYFIYGAYRDTPSFNAVMRDTDGSEVDIELLGFGADDYASNMEMFVVAVDFTNLTGHDVIDWTFASTNGRFMGLIVTEVFGNNAPVFAADPINGSDATEDTAYVGTLSGSATDDDGDMPVYAKVSGPAWLSVATDGTLSGTPTNSDAGTNVFTVSVTDGIIATPVEATLNIEVLSINDAPLASSDSVTTAEDTAVAITLIASDEETVLLDYLVTSAPTNGTLSGTAPDLTYTPNANYEGSDSFSFVANDGTVDSNTATVSITVNAVNDVPVASSDSVTTAEDTAVAISLIASDEETVSLSYILTTPPTNGTLSGTAPDLTYTPNANYGGSDSFSFVANDGSVDSNTATVSITVNAVNDVPVASSDSVATDEDTAVAITLIASDVETVSLGYLVTSAPTNGTLSGTAPDLTYTPNANYEGSDSFSFVANDGSVDSNTATVSITVNALNDVPLASSDSVATDEDTAVAITLIASDEETVLLDYLVTSAPTNGTLSGTAPDLTYTPNANYEGSDSFSFVANDGSVDSNTATVSITVNAVNDVPVASSDSVATDEDTALAITLIASDEETVLLDYLVTSAPTNGTLSGTAPDLTYTPNANYEGSDSFGFVANDGTVDSNTATVSITVNAVNDVPLASSDSVATDEDTAVAITLIASDEETVLLDYLVTSAPTNGTLSGTAPDLTYTPNANYEGSDSFSFVANDGTVDSNTATVSITVNAVNDVPVFIANPIAGSDATEDAAYVGTIAGSATDVDAGASLVYSKVSGPAWLSVAANGTLSGTPTNSDVGANVFTVSVTDTIAAPVNATLNITVINTNDAPVFTVDPISAINARVDSAYSGTIEGSAVDVDAGAELVYTKVSGPAWMSVAANGTLSGTPVISDLGINTFIVNVTDGIIGAPVEATLEINVTEFGSSLSQAAFFIVASQNAPTANLDFDVSVYDGMAGFKGQGNVGSLSVPVDEDIPGTIVDYRFINESSTPDVAQIYTEKLGSDIISETALTGIGSLQNIGIADLWTVSDPGVDYSTTADFSSDTVTVGVSSITGSVDVSSLTSGTIYFIYGGYRTTPSFDAVMRDTDGSEGDIELLGFGADDSANNLEMYVVAMDFTNLTGHDVIDWTYTSSNGRFMGLIVTEVSGNNAPVFAADPINGSNATEDTAYVGTLSGSATDDDGDTPVYAKVSGPAWLSVATDGTLSGTPTNSDAGTNVFTVSVTDEIIATPVEATLNIEVLSINDAPLASSDSVTTDEDTAVAITLIASDEETVLLDYLVTSAPTNGTLSGTAPDLTYTPNANYEGSDSFSFVANDGSVDSNVATVNITVNAVNDAPVFVANPIAGSDATQGVSYLGTIDGSATDEDAGASLAYSKVSGPAWLTVATNGTLSGTPTNGDVGVNVFTVSVSDEIAPAVEATLNVTVININDAPMVDAGADQAITMTAGGAAWTPAEANSFAWYDAADASTITQSGGAVSQWRDKSGNGKHANQANSNKRPVTGLKSIGSLNVLDFEKSANQSFVIPTIDVVGKEVWVVFEIDDYTTTSSQLFLGGGGNVQVGVNSSTQNLRFWKASATYSADTKSTATVPVDTATFAGWLGHTDTKKFSINGELENTGDNYLSGSMNATSIGSGQYTSMDAAVGELIITPTLSPEDRQKMEGYLAHKWGMEANLPAAHPYKSAAPGGEPSLAVATLDAMVSDPDGDAYSSDWTVTSGPAGVSFADATAEDTTATFTAEGTYVLRHTANDSNAATGFDEVTITVDATAPTLAASAIVDDQGGANVTENDLVTYTVSFSEDMDASSVDATDFSNAGTSSVSIGAVTETSPGVFSVEVTPTTVGTLQLQVSAAAVLTDLAGNALDTASAILDDTVITVELSTATVPNVVGLAQATAESNIVAANLAVGTVTQQTSASVPLGSVISQGLTAGSSVPQGSLVDLVISLGDTSSPNLVRLTVSSVSNTGWTTVDLGQTYTSPIILATPIYPTGVLTPVVTRITNITSTGFDLKLDRADGQTGAVSFDVSIIAVNEGVYTQATDGVKMEAVKFTSTITSGKNAWAGELRSYQNSYTNPVVLGQVMSANDANWSTFWSMGSGQASPADASNLSVGKHVGEDPNNTRANEVIGYIVIESGNGTINGVAYEAGLGSDIVQGLTDSSTPFTYSLSGSLSSASAVALSQAAMDDSDGSWAVLAGSTPFSPTSLSLYVVEDTLGDTEQGHTDEQVGYIVFE